MFSYTAAGQAWIYPVGSGLLFYAAYLLGGYALLSWLGAAAACGTVALLLRKGSAVTAALAIVAVPLIVMRAAPRAEMFTVVLFAAFLSILWENYRSGSGRLWLLPLLMLAWVNLHLGFVSGLALVVAFIGVDVLQMLDRTRRAGALGRLRHASPWHVATALATLVNPWGWNIYAALIRQNRLMAEHSEWISEWGKLPLNGAAVVRAFNLHEPSPFYLLLAIGAIAVVAALWQREWGAACLLLAGAYQGVQHLRNAGARRVCHCGGGRLCAVCGFGASQAANANRANTFGFRGICNGFSDLRRCDVDNRCAEDQRPRPLISRDRNLLVVTGARRSLHRSRRHSGRSL